MRDKQARAQTGSSAYRRGASPPVLLDMFFPLTKMLDAGQLQTDLMTTQHKTLMTQTNAKCSGDLYATPSSQCFREHFPSVDVVSFFALPVRRFAVSHLPAIRCLDGGCYTCTVGQDQRD